MSKLKRKLGFWHAYATATGLVVAGSTLVTLGTSMGLTGSAFIVSTLIALVISIIIALSYAELSSILPGAGMIGDYTSVAMGKFMAIVSVLCGYFVLVATVGAAETMTAGSAVQSLFPNVNVTLIMVLLLSFFLVVNLLGVEIFGFIQVILTLIMMITLSVMGILGLFGILTVTSAKPVAFNPAGWGTVFQSISLSLWLFIGIEFVLPLAEEVKNPNKTIPKAMIIGLISIFIADMLFGQAIVHYIDLGTLSSSATPHIDGVAAMFGGTGKTLMVIITIFAAASSINSNFAVVPRMFYGLARDGLLPKIFAYLHPTFRTPWTAIIFVYLLFCVPLFLLKSTGEILSILILSACTTWILSYIIAQVNVLILRRKYPEIDRPFKAPFTPYLQIAGILSCVYMIATIHPDPVLKRQIYAIAGGFTVSICLYAFIWLKMKKIPLFQPVPLDIKKSEIIAESEEITDCDLEIDFGEEMRK